jgi:hypothetical protein
VFELLNRSGDGGFQRAIAEAVPLYLIEGDVDAQIGTGRRQEHSGDRLNYRNGYSGAAVPVSSLPHRPKERYWPPNFARIRGVSVYEKTARIKREIGRWFDDAAGAAGQGDCPA